MHRDLMTLSHIHPHPPTRAHTFLLTKKLKWDEGDLHEQWAQPLCAWKEGTTAARKPTFFPPHLGLSLCLSLSNTHARACTCPRTRPTQRWQRHSGPPALSVGECHGICSGLQDVSKRIPSHAKIALLSRGWTVTLQLRKHNHFLIIKRPVSPR